MLKPLLLVAALASLSACATFSNPKPQVPCEAWQAAEASWAATSQYVAARLEEQRALACYTPPPPTPPAPAPAQSLSCPGVEVPTPKP